PTGGFPSGHVLNLTAIFGFLAYLVILYVANRPLRWLVVALLAVPVVIIGVARVYAGAHWPSDALGGYLIGGIWLALTIHIYPWARARGKHHHHHHHDDTSMSGNSVGQSSDTPVPVSVPRTA